MPFASGALGEWRYSTSIAFVTRHKPMV